MSEYFEIAYATVSGKLCLFTGTGFSKAVTDNEAPSWQGLLESICDLTPEPASLKAALFPPGEKNVLSLEEAAQVIAIELSKVDKNIHEEIAARIRALTLKGDNSAVQDFLSKRTFKVATTNYDKLIEDLSGEADCHSLTPGLPIPRSQSRVKIYHVHGSIDSYENMVVTSDDYFRFINSESYFSRKLSTVLHENTVVIIGYSLGDNNLKAIISDYKGFSRSHVIGSNIFLISRSKVDQHIKDYYAHCYGIRVLDRIEVHDFFKSLNAALPEAEKRFAKSIDNIRKVVFENLSFKKDYLKIENSFFEIVSSLAAIGVSINDSRVVKALGDIIRSKTELTQESGAWVQYEHLARWLAYLSSILELKGTSIEQIYLEAACRSMKSMRKELYIGYSWHAYKSWSSRWPGIIASNRALIRKHIEANTTWPDALAVVRSA
ncbi:MULTISPECIES: SIR2 family protein [unclassified Simplicispira]|uniref:SIR2 family NAD-dependent protein deacylase n=1 Tax=unclassified Simplicispira TaxID=2630407 RepID=UPI000D5ECE17|nr:MULTISPECIES: SIR2 family protein [unclassified Simplicispira]PVY55790.1 SIR2-like protein [Simplicispira sp. 125]REG16733.1 SIR2-like protein [Simplicispira sp. 110]